jgi:hypothetical protein
MFVPPTIAFGSAEAAAVVAAQRCLNVANARELSKGNAAIGPSPLTEDGLFGNLTQNAVLSFQALFGMVPTGVVDPGVWTLLLAGIGPGSGVSSGAQVPVDGSVRWSVSVADILLLAGQAATAKQLAGVSVTVGGTDAADPALSPDGSLVHFTAPAGAEGAADLVLTGGDGSVFTLGGAVTYTASFPAGLDGLCVAAAIGVQEAALVAAAMEVGRIRGFVDGAAAALLGYQDALAQMFTRFQDPAVEVSATDGAAWTGHWASRARMVAGIVNVHCLVTLSTDAVADLDGLPFGGADDLPTLDTGATVLLMTSAENVILPSVVDLTA